MAFMFIVINQVPPFEKSVTLLKIRHFDAKVKIKFIELTKVDPV
jgi:hypothetical protein